MTGAYLSTYASGNVTGASAQSSAGPRGVTIGGIPAEAGRSCVR